MWIRRKAFPKHPKNSSDRTSNIARFRVMFVQPDGKPLDIWYTFGNRSEAEAFAKQVCEADRSLRPKVISLDSPDHD
jgi:hypothetical protein